MSGAMLAMAEGHLAAARILLALWLMLVSAHWMAAAELFGPDGATPLARMRGRGIVARLRCHISVHGLRGWMLLQFSVAALLLIAPTPPLAIACLTAALLSHGGFILLSGAHGSSGADKMGLIVLAGTLIGTIAADIGDAALLLAACLISGGQLLICYMVAGLSKLRQPEWRSGQELAGVMAHPVWGAAWAAALVRPPGMARAASWALMLGEALFPLALFAPQPVLVAALAAMLLFHIATAVIMRLTLFPWAFAAAYPSVLLLGHGLRGAFG